MKRTIFKTMAVLMAVLACLSLHAVNSITYTTAYNDSALTLGTDTLGGVTYSTISYEGLYNGGAPGTPSLPIDYIRFSVPWNATNFTVSATTINNPIQPLGYQLYPNQLPQLMSDTIGWSITLPDSSAYQNNVFYPANRAWVVDEGFLAGENHIVTVAVMPVDYRHRLTSYMDQHQYRLSRAVNLTLSYELSDTLAMYPIVRQNTALRSEGYRLAQRMVVNPGNVITNAPTSMMPDTMIVVNLGSGAGEGLRYGIDSTGVYYDTIPINHEVAQMAEHNYPYLIVTTPEMEHAVRRIAALKNQKGLRTKVVTMDEVINNSYARYGDLIKQPDGTYAVVDTSCVGKLRQYLKFYHIFYGTEYVLLVGTDIPYKYIPSDFIYHCAVPSDIYCSDLNYDWSGSIIRSDLWPELYIGRILAKSADQIDNYTDKLLKYELNPGNGNYSYLKRAFCLEGRSYLGELQNTKNSLNSMFPSIININDTNSNNKYPKGKNIIDTLRSNPVGFVCMLNHGDTTRILVYGYDNDSSRFFIKSTSSLNTGNGLNCLQNKDFPMIFYAPNCTTVPFDNYSGINMGESFTTGKDYGGPVYIGYTRKVYEFPIRRILEEFVGRLNDYGFILGKTDAFSKMHAISSSRDESVIHAFLGDPSLEIWTDEPNHYSEVSIFRSNNTISISGINADSTIVAFYNNDGSYYQHVLTTTSATFNNVSPNSSAIIYKHNYIPYILPLTIQNEVIDKDQYVIASDVIAGNSVDNDRTRTNGDVVVRDGVDYEIEASGTVTLEDGFKVEKGATFAVYPSSY